VRIALCELQRETPPLHAAWAELYADSTAHWSELVLRLELAFVESA